MPFKSEKQRKFLYAKKPKLAEKFSKEGRRKKALKKMTGGSY